MEINSLPAEVLSYIIGFLPWKGPGNYTGIEVELDDLRKARLVCRQWNTIASAHLFRDIALLHTSDGKDFSKFKAQTASPMVQNAARCAVIYSGPHHHCQDMANSDVRSYEDWDEWDTSEYKEFTDAIDCIVDLPKLNAVHIRFSNRCSGDHDDDYYWEMGIEKFSTRMKTIEAVFTAMQARKARGGNTTINTMAIEGLQNMPFLDFVASDLFKSVAGDIAELRLLVAEEYNEHGPDHDLKCLERRTFEPWLQNTLLPVFANQLTSLHLAFNDNWGVAPGYFDGKGLQFPYLKTLTLSDFVIGHHDQFDWVLNQTTLETLRLDRCLIVSHLKFHVGSVRNPENQLRDWQVKTHDWTEHPLWAFGISERSRVFTFSRTWEALFDDIRSRLPSLVDFRNDYKMYRSDNKFNTAEYLGCGLSCLRYVTLDTGLLPSPWIEANEFTGDMSFGNNDPTPLPLDERKDAGWPQPKCKLNRAEETLTGDSRAFRELVLAVEGRRRKRGLAPISF
ncbi:hypothetical protein B0T14DRAFT_432182 [Immersiella caudata]|uniref:F-box domain-containing protein n=1 Tax=Immersiella caudata TaxID=314043 RepID=A0AA39WQF2_9PEZI|nr:hypothetical protein B0T14DRAFT_432182 [Immersiella caudata]